MAKGTVIYSGADTKGWQGTKSGVITGHICGEAVFSDLALNYESDQIHTLPFL